MTSYKKGLLSLAAVIAMTSGVSAQNYVPLTSDKFDYRWSLFGVDGFKLDGAAVAGTASFSAAPWTTITDTGANDVATLGYSNMVELKALNITAPDNLASVTMNMDPTGESYVETEPMRTMFIKLPNLPTLSTTGEANVMVTYKASLEGKDVEFRVNGTTTYTFETSLSALKTYDVADDLEAAIKSADTNGSAGDDLRAIEDVADYDFSNNPLDSDGYNSNLHRDAMGVGSTRLYTFDAVSASWKIYDSNNAAAANDFSALSLGVAYWGRMDLDGSESSVNANELEAGMVLGTGGIDSSKASDGTNDYLDNNLSAGWNLMSFSSDNPDIINATTGMIIQHAGDGNVTIYDTTGVNNVVVNFGAVGGTPEIVAEKINLAVEAGKARGDFSDTFNLRAFGANTTTLNQLVLISNKRFTIAETNGTAVSLATSLAGGNLWDIESSAYVNVTDVNASGTTSIYGDYALAFRPMVGAGTASHLDSGQSGDLNSSAIMINDDADSLVILGTNNASSDINTTSINMATRLTEQPDILGNAASATGNAIAIDINNSSADNYIIAASDTPFYIKDHTFTRAYTYTLGSGVDTFNYAGAKGTSSVTSTVDTRDGILSDINDSADTGGVAGTGVYAAAGTAATTLLVISAHPDTNFFNVHDTAGEYLADTTDAGDIAKGAVADVELLNTLAKRTINPYKVTYSISDVDIVDGLDTAGDAFKVGLADVNATGSSEVVTGAVDSTVAAEVNALFNQIVTDIQELATSRGDHVFVSHDFNVSDPDVNGSLITVEGYSYAASNIYLEISDNDTSGGGDINATESNVNTTFGTLTQSTGDVTQDLKFNAVSTPTYAKAGPLYMLKDLGWTAKSMITGSTNMTAGTIAWDNIDLTRSTSQMFDDQDFNLFTIDPKAGYWVYLEDTSTETNDLNITVVGSTLTPTVTHHFDADAVTARNHISTNLTVLISGLPTYPTGEATTEKVWANVGGTNVELTGDPVTGQYTADIDSYAIALNANDITVSVSDGKEWLLNSVSVGTIDITKPQAPITSLVGGFTIEANATDTDVEGFYLFKDSIVETSMHSATARAADTNFISFILPGATALDFCSNASIAFDGQVNLKAVAVDGNGTFTKGNISDVTSEAYYAIQKGSIILEHNESTGGIADDLGVPYNNSCVVGTVYADDNGTSIKSVTTDVNVKFAIEPIAGVSFDTDIPYTIYVTDGTNIAEIKYAPAYGSKDFYVQFDGTAYFGTLPASDVANFYNTTLAADITGGDLTSGAVGAQSF